MPRSKANDQLQRYSACLLFQFRVVVDGDSGKRRLCEKRIIHFRATDPRAALRHAKLRGKEAEHAYRNSDGNRVSFEFIGVRDLLHCGAECEGDEVWYQICELLTPMERKDTLIPAEGELAAFREMTQLANKTVQRTGASRSAQSEMRTSSAAGSRR
jgi:hypothetical protein